MCGIAGFYDGSGAADREGLAQAGAAMHRAIAHRGPDSAGVWVDPGMPLVLSHRRLAIHDLTEDGAQPMASPSGRYMVVYNGEIYNYRELQAELERLGHHFKTRCDTEILLAAVDHWGLNETLQKLNGMFAIALWDRLEKRIHFVRDRFGKKPLYVGWAGNALVFASELKAFHTRPGFAADIDRNVTALYMRFGYVCAPYAIFKNTWQLLPAGRLTLDVASLTPGEDLSRRMETYWSLRDKVADARANPVRGGEREILGVFGEKLSLAVKRRMDCDVPFGSFLSGGIDSSLVTAMMQEHSARAVKTYSIGFGEDGYDESAHAARVAAHLGTDHHEFRVGADEAINLIPSLPDMFDEPFADASQIPTHLISRLARSHVTVALTGDGGDEILGGYQRHTHIPALWNRISWMPSSLRRRAGNILLKIPQDTFDRLNPAYPQFGRRMHRMAQVVAQGDSESLYAALLEVWPEKDGVVPGAVMPPIPLDDPAQWPSGLSLSEKMIYADTLSYRPNDLMVKTDRATMSVALEARAPLMDHELCEYSWRLPHDMKIRGFEGKWLLRRLLEKHVPRDLFERPKAGFNVPLRQWLRGPLKGWAEDMLSERRLKEQGILNAPLVAGRWQDFLAGRGGHANANDIWSALMFQSWHARWIGK